MAVLAASGLQFASKPLIAHVLGGWGANPQAYLQSNYALVSQSLGTVFGSALALLILAILVRDVLAEVTSRSETDTLSRWAPCVKACRSRWSSPTSIISRPSTTASAMRPATG